MKAKHYDVFVIGSGIAGQTAAKKIANTGKKVAIADNRMFGGTCATRGCDPKKVLLQFTDLVKKSKQLKKVGVEKHPKLNWKTIQKFKSSFTKPVPPATESDLKDLGIDLYHQSPKFISTSEVTVEGKTISADNFVIATGLIPQKLNIKGNKYLQTSDDILNLKKIPKSVIFIGSGYIGLEFCYMFSTLGCNVTMLDTGHRILKTFDNYLTKKLTKILRKRGVKFIFNAETTQIKKLNKNHKVTFKQNGKIKAKKARLIFNTAGRIPAVETLDLEKASIAFDETGILVNNFLQNTTNKNIYACGDVSSKSLPLTPLSGLQGHIVGENILKQNSEEFKNPLVPSVVFTHPQLASVGYTEDDAKSRYKTIEVYKGDASDWFNAKKEKEDGYAYKILVNKRTQQIVGAHLLSSNASETINILTMAMNAKMKIDTFKSQIFTYPSFTNDLKSMFSN